VHWIHHKFIPGVSLSGLKDYPEVPVLRIFVYATPIAKHLEQTLPSVYTIHAMPCKSQKPAVGKRNGEGVWCLWEMEAPYRAVSLENSHIVVR